MSPAPALWHLLTTPRGPTTLCGKRHRERQVVGHRSLVTCAACLEADDQQKRQAPPPWARPAKKVPTLKEATTRVVVARQHRVATEALLNQLGRDLHEADRELQAALEELVEACRADAQKGGAE